MNLETVPKFEVFYSNIKDFPIYLIENKEYVNFESVYEFIYKCMLKNINCISIVKNKINIHRNYKSYKSYKKYKRSIKKKFVIGSLCFKTIVTKSFKDYIPIKNAMSILRHENEKLNTDVLNLFNYFLSYILSTTIQYKISNCNFNKFYKIFESKIKKLGNKEFVNGFDTFEYFEVIHPKLKKNTEENIKIILEIQELLKNHFCDIILGHDYIFNNIFDFYLNVELVKKEFLGYSFLNDFFKRPYNY